MIENVYRDANTTVINRACPTECVKETEALKVEVARLREEVIRLDTLSMHNFRMAEEARQRAEAAEARCTKYTTEIAGLHEKLEAAEAKCAELELKLKEAASVQV
jgi:uncharacterized coiled-coil DUF342 family protein